MSDSRFLGSFREKVAMRDGTAKARDSLSENATGELVNSFVETK